MEKKLASMSETGCLIWALIIFLGIPMLVFSIFVASFSVEQAKKEKEIQMVAEAITIGDGRRGGTKFICYNEDKQKYDFLYCGDDAPQNGDEVGLIVRYTSTMRRETGIYYSYNPNAMTSGSHREVTWSLETLNVTLADRATGKILAEKTFTAELPKSYGSKTDYTIEVSDYYVREWISEVWPDYQRNAG